MAFEENKEEIKKQGAEYEFTAWEGRILEVVMESMRMAGLALAVRAMATICLGVSTLGRFISPESSNHEIIITPQKGRRRHEHWQPLAYSATQDHRCRQRMATALSGSDDEAVSTVALKECASMCRYSGDKRNVCGRRMDVLHDRSG